MGMWHPRGYGGNGAKDAVVFDGFEHALVPSWQGDNHGPANVKSYINTYEKIRKEFPNAIVFSSTYNNFTKRLVDIRDKLPVVTSEIGDTVIITFLQCYIIYHLKSDAQAHANCE